MDIQELLLTDRETSHMSISSSHNNNNNDSNGKYVGPTDCFDKGSCTVELKASWESNTDRLVCVPPMMCERPY